MIEVAIFIIGIIVFLSFLIGLGIRRKVGKFYGGYTIPDDSYERSSGSRTIQTLEDAIEHYISATKDQYKNYTEGLAFYFFQDDSFQDTLMPKGYNYFGGMKLIKNYNDLKWYINQRYDIGLTRHRIFNNDLTVIIDEDHILLIEFDEKGSYHQKNDDLKYVIKNIIYDQLLCESSSEEINVCILRIKYSGNILGLCKDDAVRAFISIIYYTILKLQSDEFANEIILAYITVIKKKPIINEFISIYAKEFDIMRSFTPTTPVYAVLDLDTRELIPSVQNTRTMDDFIITDLLPDLRDKAFIHYVGSPYETYFNSKINRTIENNPFNEIIESFDNTNDYFNIKEE